MKAMSRRSFLEVASASFGSAAVPWTGPALFTSQASGGTPTRIYAVFFDIAPSRDDSDIIPLANNEILRRLEYECRGVGFEVRDLTRGVRLEEVLNEVRDLPKDSFDGVLVYGWPRDYDLLRTGLPTINVAVVNDFQNVPYPLFRENRVVGAYLDPWRFSADSEVSDRMFADLADKIRLLQALKRMKSEHVLTVTDSPFVSVVYGDLLRANPAGYNESMLEAITRTFGTRVTKIGTREVTEDPVIRELWHSESREANDIAHRWIGVAEDMTYTIESEVVRSAKVYLAMKHLMEKYEASAIAYHIRTLTADPRPEDLVYPALATSEFQIHNQVGKCQSHLNILLSEMLLQYAYGRPSMLGDYSVDTYNGTSCVQHCEGPWNPWGDERRVPYILTDHRERRIRSRRSPGVGAASWILYPAGEPVTTWQLEVLNRELLLHTGNTIEMLRGPVKYKDHLWKMM